MKKISNFLKSNYKKIIVSVTCVTLLLVTGFSFLKPKQVNADTNIDAPTIRTKEYFNETFFNRDYSNDLNVYYDRYLSMFTNTTHNYSLGYYPNNSTTIDFETLTLSFGNNFSILDNENLVLTSTSNNSNNSGNLLVSKSSGVAVPYYVIYNNANSSRGCYRYTLSYDNFIMPAKHVVFDDATGEPQNNYERNVGFGLFINAFRDFFSLDRVFFSSSSGGFNAPLDVVCRVTLPNSSILNNDGTYSTNEDLVYEAKTYTFTTERFTDGKIGELYDDLFYDDNGYVGNIEDIYVPRISSNNVTTYEGIIDYYQYFVYVPKIEFTFTVPNGSEGEFLNFNCYHRTPFVYSNVQPGGVYDCFLNKEFNTFVRTSICGTDKVLNELYNFGYDDGYDTGYKKGHHEGYIEGHYDGYEEGYISNSNWSNPFDVILEIVGSFFDFEPFPGFKIWHIILFAFGMALFGAILKFAMGG